MPPTPDFRRELASTYFVQDRSSDDELSRLHLQDTLITASMGGVFPEQPEPARFQRVLDVGCGTGGWLIDMAKAHPEITLLVGVDANRAAVAYARAQAQAAQVAHRVEFQVMDALRMLEFPDLFFDLVNQRFGQSWLRTWDWPKLLHEYRRVATIGGVLRLTESDLVESNSPALNTLARLLWQASFQAGHLFRQTPDGGTGELARLLTNDGCRNVQTHVCSLRYDAGTPEGERFADNVARVFRVGLPFVRTWATLPESYELLYQQMLLEMRQPDFVATLNVLTAWGQGAAWP